MGPKLFIAVAVLAWVPTVSVHASTDIPMTGRAFMGPAGRTDAMTELTDEDPASAKNGEITSLGGAIYSPFADVPKAHSSQQAVLKRSPKDVSMGLTIFVILAGVAMVGRFLKKTWDDW